MAKSGGGGGRISRVRAGGVFSRSSRGPGISAQEREFRRTLGNSGEGMNLEPRGFGMRFQFGNQ